ncbi:hypothetical protein B5P43_24465 [Bacillus sp. SRB_336]|nr:hypothetical protein B5P43_24465 [Bacillus sp. SRB_336]
MAVKEFKSAKKGTPGSGSVADWIAARDPSFTEADLTAALEDQLRGSGTVSLSVQDRAFWDTSAGITVRKGDVAAAAAANAASMLVSDSSALTAGEVAQQLNLSASTIRHYKASGRLYSYEHRGKLRFPIWQFSADTRQAIPFIANVLESLPRNAHPQTISGFFQTPQPDLVVDGVASSPKRWLESGGEPGAVISMADELTSGY